jgi:ElaB/YqjD/DUF883 family membrane-anchored ribosome-binding protein
MWTYRIARKELSPLERITAQMEEGIRRGKYSLDELQSAMKHKTLAAARHTDEYVHDHPWKIIGIVALLGVLTGIIMRR